MTRNYWTSKDGQLDTLTKQHAQKTKNRDFKDSHTTEFFVEIFLNCPEITIYGVEATAEVGTTVTEVSSNIISNSPELTATVVEGTGELAGSVFEVIIEIVAGVLSG